MAKPKRPIWHKPNNSTGWTGSHHWARIGGSLVIIYDSSPSSGWEIEITKLKNSPSDAAIRGDAFDWENPECQVRGLSSLAKAKELAEKLTPAFERIAFPDKRHGQP